MAKQTLQAARHKWYVAAVELGKEVRFRADLLRKARIADAYPRQLKSIMVPADVTTEPRQKDGKPHQVKRLTFPGYVLICAEWGAVAQDLIQAARFYMTMLMPRPAKPSAKAPMDGRAWCEYLAWEPTPLETKEAAVLLLKARATAETKVPAVPKFRIGDRVTVTDLRHFLRNTEGVVVGHGAGDLVKIECKILGAPFRAELELWQFNHTK